MSQDEKKKIEGTGDDILSKEKELGQEFGRVLDQYLKETNQRRRTFAATLLYEGARRRRVSVQTVEQTLIQAGEGKRSLPSKLIQKIASLIGPESVLYKAALEFDHKFRESHQTQNKRRNDEFVNNRLHDKVVSKYSSNLSLLRYQERYDDEYLIFPTIAFILTFAILGGEISDPNQDFPHLLEVKYEKFKDLWIISQEEALDGIGVDSRRYREWFDLLKNDDQTVSALMRFLDRDVRCWSSLEREFKIREKSRVIFDGPYLCKVELVDGSSQYFDGPEETENATESG